MADGGSEADMLTLGTGNYELSVPATEGRGRKVLGSREFALYYRQRHRAVDTRQSVTVNAMVARCASRDLTVHQERKCARS